MSATRTLRWALPLLLVLGVACTSPGISVKGAPALANHPARDGDAQLTSSAAPDGVDLLPLHIASFVFGGATDLPRVQPPSEQLARVPDRNRLLHVFALPSGLGTAAIAVVEDSPKGARWGVFLTPAQRRIFSAFAADRTLGDWLVIVDDVNVLKGIDAVPMTAYRWTRDDVETYARCGIPLTGIDECTAAFYRASQEVLVIGSAHGRPGY